MAPWKSGTLNQEDGTLVARVRFRPPAISQQAHNATTFAGSERVLALSGGEGEYEVVGEHLAALVDQAVLMLRRSDGWEIRVHIREGPFGVATGSFDAKSEWTKGAASSTPT